MDTFISRSPEETLALGERWGREAQRGWLIGLSGELGAGKTQLVRGMARGLGSPARVHSPSFTLVHEYGGGRLPLFHLDLYRLLNAEQVVAAGLESCFTPVGVTVVEWVERWMDNQVSSGWPGPGVRFRQVNIEILGETERCIRYEDTCA